MKENIKIAKDGILMIERAGEYKVQGCPKVESYCGDWCPLFREPHQSPNTGLVQISLCETEIICNIFKDERLNGGAS